MVDSAEVEAPIEIDLFYGDDSHVVHVKPTSDLLADEVYVVTVDPGVQTIHGESLAGWSFTFSTGRRHRRR
ncbi:Ig-like domain-containing protein [Nannocystis pusilla]|uniref:Ig-like domain-containing protein n=1 Tax=Nannocystis pusilla TaxID=889268 RepID=UPI003B7672F9